MWLNLNILCAISVTTLRCALKTAANFSDDVHFLHAFHLKSTINANFVYIPVEATSSMSTVCTNHYIQYVLTRMVYRFLHCVLTLISAEQYLTERTSDNNNNNNNNNNSLY